jgi:hypothetical protein
MRALQTKESVAFGLNAVREVVRREGDPDDLNTIDPKRFYSHDLLISRWPFPSWVEHACSILRDACPVSSMAAD